MNHPSKPEQKKSNHKLLWLIFITILCCVILFGSWYIDLGFVTIRTGEYSKDTSASCLFSNREDLNPGESYTVYIEDGQCYTLQNTIEIGNLSGIPHLNPLKSTVSKGDPDILESDEFVFELSRSGTQLTVIVTKK